MKILFVNLSDIRGGAAKSMWRIGEELSRDNSILYIVRHKFTDAKNVIATRDNWLIDKIEWLINFLFNVVGLQYKFLPFSSFIMLRTARKFKPDVISLNQIEGGYFQTRDIIKLQKIAPIVWTMHDMWAFTGNASHTYGDESFTRMDTFKGENTIYPHTGINNGRWLLKQKKKIYDKSDFTVVSPSDWLRDQAWKSPLLQGKDKLMIPHGIDYFKFSPMKQKNILFIAEKLSKFKYMEHIK